MLSGRQIHVHHALGLGPMWLPRAAHVITPDANDAIAQRPVNTLPAADIAQTLPIAATRTTVATASHAKPVAAATATAVNSSDATTVAHKVSKRAAALLAHIAQAQQYRPSETKNTPVPTETHHISHGADYADDDFGGLQHKIRACTACDLHTARRQALVADMPSDCRLVVVLPHASVQDDAAGELLGGEVGDMWRNIVKAIKLTPEQVYITSAIKCAPNMTLVPKAHHAASCIGYLQRELQLLPDVPVLLLAENQRSLKTRLQEFVGTERLFSIPHPSKMQRDPNTKKLAWSTLQAMMAKIQAA